MTLAAAGLFLAPAAGHAQTQTTPPTTKPGRAAPAADISEQKLDAAAKAVKNVSTIRDSYEQKLIKAPAEQAYVSLAFRMPQIKSVDEDSDAWALVVLSAVLDGYAGARLDRALTQGPDRVADSVGAYAGFVGRGPQLFGLDGVPSLGIGGLYLTSPAMATQGERQPESESGRRALMIADMLLAKLPKA